VKYQVRKFAWHKKLSLICRTSKIDNLGAEKLFRLSAWKEEKVKEVAALARPLLYLA
jgi:hypothetical protein